MNTDAFFYFNLCNSTLEINHSKLEGNVVYLSIYFLKEMIEK